MLRYLLALLLVPAAFASDWFLFTSFRKNGETGVYFALSQDGRRWTPLKSNQPWIAPEHEGMLMRDPFLARGPDAVWHMLWTWGWSRKDTGGGLKIGHATSRDLVNWSSQREIPIFQNEPAARNAWAPEAVWDSSKNEWIVFWSTTIPGRFAQTEASGDSGYNHRMYSMTTKDWVSFSEPRLWFDPGFNCIDGTLVHDGKLWRLIFKDERKTPLQKRLRLASADSPEGPWKSVSEPFTHVWVEGPSAIRIGQDWWIYFDNYTEPRHYGALTTRDWKTFKDVTSQLSFPEDHRHGTVVRITEEEAKLLQVHSR
jgi:hypothetical protein